MKDKHTYGKKMARKGRTKVIYKGTFISKQSLFTYLYIYSLLTTVIFKHFAIQKLINLGLCLLFVLDRE